MSTAPPAFNAKNAGRISLGRQQKAPTPASVKEAVVEKKSLTVAERMAITNPAFTLLVKTLDLEVLYTQRLPVDPPQPIPPLPPILHVATPHTERLRALAVQTYRPNTCYSPDEALQLLAIATNRPVDRATNGLTMMVEQGVLSLTLANDYYLTDSTPF
jgi:hypothetical protein